MNVTKRRFRGRIGAGVALALGFLAVPALADDTDTLHRATDLVMQEIARLLNEGVLNKAQFEGVERVAVARLGGDKDGYATDALKRAIVEAGFKLYSRDEPEYNRLLKEMTFVAEYGDLMGDSADGKDMGELLAQFEKFPDVDAIVLGRISDQKVNLWSIRGTVTASINLGGTKTLELWPSGPVTGEAYIHWSDALMQFWRYPLVLFGMLVILLILVIFLARLKKAYRPL